MRRGLTVVSFVNLCQLGVKLCHGLVSVGQTVVTGGEGGAAGLRGATVGVWVIGVWESVGGRSGPLTPHLTSPLEGGRDELGE